MTRKSVARRSTAVLPGAHQVDQLPIGQSQLFDVGGIDQHDPSPVLDARDTGRWARTAWCSTGRATAWSATRDVPAGTWIRSKVLHVNMRLARRRVEPELVDRIGQPEAARLAHPIVEVLEVGHHPGYRVADHVVVGLEVLPRDRGRVAERPAREPAHDRHLAQQMLRCRGESAVRLVHDAHRVFDRDELFTGRLDIAVTAAQRGQDQRGLAAHRVREVELRRDVGRQSAVPHRPLGQLAVGGRPHEIACEADEQLRPSVAHGPDRVNRVQAVLRRGSEAELPLQRVEERLRHLLPDAHRPVALDVAVPAHRAHTGSWPTQIPAQHQEVHDLADGRHTVLLLGDAHRPAHDDLPAGQHAVDDLLDLLARKSGRLKDICPRDLSRVVGEVRETRGVGVDELEVQHAARGGVLGLQQKCVDRLEQCQVAARLDVQELIGDRGSPADEFR